MTISRSNLDILTPKGQISREQEKKAIAIWADNFPSISYCETPKNEPSAVDSVLVKDNQIMAVVETKCRSNISYEGFKNTFGNLWLVTFEKILKAKTTAELLSVPFVGFLYLVEDDILLFETIWKPHYGWNIKIEIDKTETQATINGGSIYRDNAYINMENAKILRLK